MQTNNAFDRVFVTLTEKQDTVLDLNERIYRNCEYKNWDRIGRGMQFCFVYLFAEILLMTLIKFQPSFMALYLCINILHWKMLRQLFVTVVIIWENGVMYSPVTYISGSRFNSCTKYFYLSTISTPRSEKSNREGMYWIRITCTCSHGCRLDIQTRFQGIKIV